MNCRSDPDSETKSTAPLPAILLMGPTASGKSALALAMAGAGPTLTAARLVNIAAGGLTVGLTYAVARRIATGRAALTAALVVALYPTLLIYTSLVATESLVIVPVLALNPARSGAKSATVWPFIGWIEQCFAEAANPSRTPSCLNAGMP